LLYHQLSPLLDSNASAPPRFSFVGVFRLLHRFPRMLFYSVTCVVHLAVVALWRRGRFTVPERAAIFHHWAYYALRASGTTTSVTGPMPVGGVVVSNHLSYLDILLMEAAAPVVFVSKKEVRHYPVIGQAAALAGAIFLDRGKTVAAQDVASDMDETLASGACVAFFPEGKTTDGGEVLRFRAALFVPPVRLGLPVHTAAIRYAVKGGGDAGELVCFWGDMAMVPHLLQLLMLPGVEATLIFGESFVPERGPEPATSRAAANRAHDLVVELRESLRA
jgi:1-acyl-sn-glycerol-3-phosphate acyltransferase